MQDTLLLGAHLSIAGGLHKAIDAGKEIGATTVQIFTANQRTWASNPILEEEVLRFRHALKETGLSHIMSHGSYLINLGSPHANVREKSLKAFREEILRCQALGVTYLNIHPGAALDSPVEECLDRVVNALLSVVDCFDRQLSLHLLLENMAGQGSVLGATFEQLAYIIDRVKGSFPIGVCMDTCHAFTAGYDIRTKSALEKTLEEFDAAIGLEYLQAMHLNDSVFDLGSHKDRHELLGCGLIGKEAFSAIMQESRLERIPKYLETPGGLEIWKTEIAWLRQLSRK